MKIKTYTRRDGFMMIYINDDASKNRYQQAKAIGIAEDCYTSKWTNGQKNLYAQFIEALNASEVKIDENQIIETNFLALAIELHTVQTAAGIQYFVEKNGKFLRAY